MVAANLAVAVLPALGALLAAGLAIYCWRRPDTLAAREFALFAGCIGVWCAFNTLEILSLEAGPRLAFGELSYLGIAFAPVAWLAFVLRYTQNDRWLRAPVPWLLALLPGGTLLLALSEPAHGLLWREVAFTLEPYPDLAIEHGPWFDLVHLPYSYALYLAGAAVLVGQAMTGSGRQKLQNAALLGAFSVPFLINVLYTVSGVTLRGLDPTPASFALSALLVGVALFGTGLLRDAPLSYYTVFLHSSDGIILVDRRGRVLDANPAALGELELREVRRRPLSAAFPPLHRALAEAGDDPAVRAVRYPSELLPGHIFEARDLALRTLGGRPTGRALLVRDVTHEEQTRATLARQAEIDPLTSLPNRRALERHAERALATDAPGATLFYLDLDDFKRVNDHHGHATGDAVLREVAERLRGALRDGDLVARIGGDEFAILVGGAAPATTEALRARLRRALERPIELGGHRHRVGASIGVAHAPAHGVTLDALLGHADAAMYREKRARPPEPRAPTRSGGSG